MVLDRKLKYDLRGGDETPGFSGGGVELVSIFLNFWDDVDGGVFGRDDEPEMFRESTLSMSAWE